MTPLRDGSAVVDPRLDAVQDFDERSRDYPVTAVLEGAELRSHTWTTLLHLNQGNDGACVGFACAHELVATPKIALKGKRFAREELYWEAQRIDQWDGGSYPNADPFMEGSSVLAGVKVLQRLGYIEEYRWAFSVDELALAVANEGPAILGLPWYNEMVKPYGCTLEVNGVQIGRHAILCKGVNPKRQTFKLHNSWGVSWGCFGDCKISWSDLDRLLQEGGEACIPIKRRRPG